MQIKHAILSIKNYSVLTTFCVIDSFATSSGFPSSFGYAICALIGAGHVKLKVCCQA